MKTKHPIKTLFTICCLAVGQLVCAQQTEQALLPEANRDFDFDYTTLMPIQFESFAAAANWADVVAIAQLVNVDYEKTRELNAKGQAFLTVRVPYKGVQKDDFLIVSSKGFEEHVCYYPNREGEGQRFLVFLKKSQNDGEYLGFNPMCQLQVLLTDTGNYALRYPFDSPIPVPEELIQTLQFNDPYARIDATDWTRIARDQHQQKFASELSEDSDMFQKFFYLTYTQGVMVYEIRKLMDIEVQPRIRSKQM